MVAWNLTRAVPKLTTAAIKSKSAQIFFSIVHCLFLFNLITASLILVNVRLRLESPKKSRAGCSANSRGWPDAALMMTVSAMVDLVRMAKAFPKAVSWASPRVREARNVDVDFTRDLEASPPEEWRREIDQTLFPGGYFKEFIFFHVASKTLILADTIINIELDKVTEPWRTATKFAGMYHPYGQIFFGMRLPLFLQRRKAEEAIKKIHAWQPQRILLSHGRCFDADADKVIHRIFGEPSR